MKYLLFIFVLSALPSLISAQVKEEFDYFGEEEKSFSAPEAELTGSFKNRTQFGMMTGAGVSVMGRGNSFTNTFVAPHLSYSISPRINLSAAAILSNTNFNRGGEMNFNPSSGFNSRSLMLGADYRITDKASIGIGFQISQGAGAFNNPMSRSFGSPFSPGFSPMMMGW
jgi:hypothetical protein